MSLGSLFIYVLPFILVILIGLLGKTRRIGLIPAVIASILLTPLGGFLLTLLLGPKREKKLAGRPRALARKA
jgi:hypothetical protein